jgi:hypothetical protein
MMASRPTTRASHAPRPSPGCDQPVSKPPTVATAKITADRTDRSPGRGAMERSSGCIVGRGGREGNRATPSLHLDQRQDKPSRRYSVPVVAVLLLLQQRGRVEVACPCQLAVCFWRGGCRRWDGWTGAANGELDLARDGMDGPAISRSADSAVAPTCCPRKRLRLRVAQDGD